MKKYNNNNIINRSKEQQQIYIKKKPSRMNFQQTARKILLHKIQYSFGSQRQ